MATLVNYKCENCDYELYADKHGHYPLMNGECYMFRCTTCNEIVEILAENGSDKLHIPHCPNCGVDTEDELYTWNPIEGRYPKCGGKMIEDKDTPILFAD